MTLRTPWMPLALLTLMITILLPRHVAATEVVHPEEIKSKRQVIYSQDTYDRLAKLWRDYCEAYPSEYAYANWMYAARYAGLEDYPRLLAAGLDRYPANPTLLYLMSMQRYGSSDDARERKYLEEAVRLAPDYADPWFSLVIIHMNARDEERLDLALRQLLTSGVITDEVMDYNYNTLIGLEPNAILITNGDNDTYPAWILKRILKIRPDVDIVNRSLLNSDWYPLYVVEQGLPRFITAGQLKTLRESAFAQLKAKGAAVSPGGPVGDTLIKMIVAAAERAGRPVYFANTLYITDVLKELAEKGRQLGLATLVTPVDTPPGEQLRKSIATWLEDFRTGGLDSWRLRQATASDAGRSIVRNYAPGIADNLPILKESAPDLRLPLFEWYIAHVEEVLPEEMRYHVAKMWACYAGDIARVDEWCRRQGLNCPPPSEP